MCRARRDLRLGNTPLWENCALATKTGVEGVGVITIGWNRATGIPAVVKKLSEVVGGANFARETHSHATNCNRLGRVMAIDTVKAICPFGAGTIGAVRRGELPVVCGASMICQTACRRRSIGWIVGVTKVWSHDLNIM
jgi:hypothetical protein